jgi:hypothetical protein
VGSVPIEVASTVKDGKMVLQFDPARAVAAGQALSVIVNW